MRVHRRSAVVGCALVLALVLALVFSLAGATGCGSSGSSAGASLYPSPDPSAGVAALGTVVDLSGFVGARPAGTRAEDKARMALIAMIDKLGYQPQTQGFSVGSHGQPLVSANVVFTKPGDSARTIVVGAHYDSAAVGQGAFDNATGVGALLDAARYLRDKRTPDTLAFVLFGAEEKGELGSTWYVKHLTPQQKQAVVCMVNLDGVATGDQLYAYSGTPLDGQGGQPNAGWPRDEELAWAKEMGIPLTTSPGVNQDYPAGTTGAWSDHAPFLRAGIPYLYFEATNWGLGDLDGSVATEAAGKVWHTRDDTLQFIQTTFPGRLQTQLRQVTTLLERFLAAPEPPAATPSPPASAAPPATATP